MSSPSKDWLGIVGGAMAMGAVIFGLGLFLLGSSNSKAKTESKDAKVEEEKKEEPAADEHGGHGDAKKKADPHAKKADAHGEEAKKDEHGKEEGKEDAHGKKSKGEKAEKGGHGEEGHGKEEKEDKSPKYPTREPRVEMEEWIGDGEKALTYGNAVQACEKFNMAYKRVQDGAGLDNVRALALLRLADATRINDTIPAQRRSERAMELYSRLMAAYPNTSQAQNAQFQVGYCYEELGQFGEAEQAFDRFVSLYPHSEKVPDARLSQAANEIVLGDPFKAKKLLQALLKQTLTPETRTRVLARIAQADLMIARQGQLPDEAALARAEAVQLRETPKPVQKPKETSAVPAPEPVVAKDTKEEPDSQGRRFVFNPLAMKNSPLTPEPKATVKAPEKKADLKLLTVDDQKELASIKPASIPDEQWKRITRSLDTGNLKEASHLMRTYLDEKDPQNGLNAEQYLAWARVLRKVAERKVTEAPPVNETITTAPIAGDLRK